MSHKYSCGLTNNEKAITIRSLWERDLAAGQESCMPARDRKPTGDSVGSISCTIMPFGVIEFA